MIKIDRSSPVPLHTQFHQILLKKLDMGEWKPGALLPSEEELQHRYNLSRTTVRQAMGDLVNEGYLARQRGKGTWVAQRNKVAYDPARSLELNDFMRQQGVVLGWRMLEVGWVAATETVAHALGVTKGERVRRIRRVRLADAVAIGYHFAYISQPTAESVNFDVLGEGGSMDYLMQLPQMVKPVVQRTLEARAATADEARLLKIKTGAPLLQLTRLVYGNDGKPIEYLLAGFCGDRFKYQITL